MIDALQNVMTFQSIFFISVGVAWGLIFGVIPGLTATLAVVILIPITYGLNPVVGMSMLIGVYIGGVSGGTVSAILLGMPGTPASIATTFDGFPMAKKGLASKALGVGITSNFIGSLIGWVFLILLAPQIARLAVKLGSFEYTAIIVFGLITVATLSGKSIYKSFIVTLLGLGIASIGIDPVYGIMRGTFNIRYLASGISPIPAMIGLLVLSQIFGEITTLSQECILPKSVIGRVAMSIRELKESAFNFIRSSLIGVGIGILPGIGGALSNIVAYDQAKKASKHPETFGTGEVQGIVASESSNNAAVGGALIPLVALGIPGDGVTAALLGGLQIHGLTPGPLLITERPDMIYGIFISYLIASIAMFLIMFFVGAKVFPSILRIKKSHLIPVVLVSSLIGSFNLQYSIKDVWTALIFGIIGYILKHKEYPLTPLVIAIILGNTFEKNLRISVIQGDGSLLPFLTRPGSLVFLLASVATILYSIHSSRRKKTGSTT